MYTQLLTFTNDLKTGSTVSDSENKKVTNNGQFFSDAAGTAKCKNYGKISTCTFFYKSIEINTSTTQKHVLIFHQLILTHTATVQLTASLLMTFSFCLLFPFSTHGHRTKLRALEHIHMRE